MEIIDNNIKELSEILAIHKVKKLRVVGSLVTMNFNTRSDLDFVVSFKDVVVEDFASNFFTLEKKLKNLFNREIDLCICQDLIGSNFWESIKNDLVLVYKK